MAFVDESRNMDSSLWAIAELGEPRPMVLCTPIGRDSLGSVVRLFKRAQSSWVADYNAVAPHSALGVRSPMQYRSEVLDVIPAGA